MVGRRLIQTAERRRNAAVREIAALAPDWDALARRTRASPFLRPAWFCAWWKAFGSGMPRMFTVLREDRLSGVLVLAFRHGALRSPSNWHSPEFGLLAETPADRAALSQSAFETRSRQVSIGFLSAEADVLALGEAAAAAGYLTLVRTVTQSPAIRTGDDLRSYEANLGPNLRQNIRRGVRRLNAQGRLRFEVETGDNELSA